ncbi:MAG: TIGR03435 family protein [Acidobacteria bacterium]|nr:TIGR03435 family protein [Acidobacteriota bacterium]
MKRIGLPALYFCAICAAQPPKFDVVSIRVVPPNTPPTMREIGFTPVLPGGRYLDSRASLFFMIAFAYDVKNPSLQLTGLPKWAESQSFAVAAKPAEGFPALPPAENRERVRLMVRAMLAERFSLRLHTETRQEAMFSLEVAKGGVKMKESAPPVPPAREAPVGAAMDNSSGRMIGERSTMAGLAGALVIFLKRPVIDRTGLTGYYDFDVKWRSPETPDGQPPSRGFDTEGAGLLISNLQSQLGLRLRKIRGPVEYWVVDQVKPPTEN